MFKRLKNYGLLVASGMFFLIFNSTAQAKSGSMMWYVHPNQVIANSITAVSPSLSAKCVTDINAGAVKLNINGQNHLLTPGNNTASFSQIEGRPLPDGRFSYSYSIIWKISGNPIGVFSLTCEGDNHLPSWLCALHLGDAGYLVELLQYFLQRTQAFNFNRQANKRAVF